MITIVDYGVGNIKAILNMFDYLSIEAQATNDVGLIAHAEKLLLPGVGAFDKAMTALNSGGLVEALEYAVHQQRVPVLGICLGMQLLARKSAEGSLPGLGWIDADVQRIEVPHGQGFKVPHMGWAEVEPSHPSSLFPLMGEGERFYFVHSYHVVCDDPTDVLATVNYGSTLCCAINRDNVWGVQFHPEKSHRFGMQLLSRFAKLQMGVSGGKNAFN